MDKVIKGEREKTLGKKFLDGLRGEIGDKKDKPLEGKKIDKPKVVKKHKLKESVIINLSTKAATLTGKIWFSPKFALCFPKGTPIKNVEQYNGKSNIEIQLLEGISVKIELPNYILG